VWTASGDPVTGIVVSKKNLAAIGFVGGSGTLAAAGLGDDITVWSIPSGDRVAVLTGHRTAVLALQCTADGRSLFSLGYDQTVRVWDVGSWSQSRMLEIPESGARGLALSPDGATAAISAEGRIVLHSVDDWAAGRDLAVPVKALYAPTYSRDGRLLAAGAADGKIRVWRTDK
jgi:WD40 repeat protein